MPPRAKITKEMIVNAGFETVRREGEKSLNVRKIAAELGCSTQPVMYSYPTVEKLREDILERAGEYHTEYIIKSSMGKSEPMLGIGLSYIRFAQEERNLFRFIFQSGSLSDISFGDMVAQNVPEPVIASLQMQSGISGEEAMEVFTALFISVHGFASLVANNALPYDESYCARILTEIYNGITEYKRMEKGKKSESDNS